MKVSSQVAEALKGLHPGVRKDIRRALDDLDAGKTRNVRPLREPYTGFFRLRVGKYRVIFRIDPTSREIFAEFLDLRQSVYQSFKPKHGQQL